MSPKTKGMIIALSILVVALLAVRWAVGPQSPGGDEDASATTRFVSPRFVGYHKGERQWSLEADSIEEAEAEEGESVVVVQRVRNGVLYRDGEEVMRFEAQSGLWRPNSADLTLEGDVVFENSDGLRFTSQQVHWNADTEVLSSPGQVYITFKDQEFVADRLHADVKADRYEFSGNVRWTSGTGGLVRARLAVYSDEAGTLEFFELDGPARFVFDGS